MIIGITGLCEDKEGRRVTLGSGKDTAAARLVEKHGFVAVALADPMKRFCQEVFDFSTEQLWGPSEKRNEDDQRYLRCSAVPGARGASYLTPRFALQRLGTEWGRDCYKDVWVDYCLRVSKGLLKNKFCYDQVRGIVTMGGTNIPERVAKGVVIPDLRFHNEAKKIRDAGGKIWRVKRHVSRIEESYNPSHGSEVELSGMPDDVFDAVLPNEGDIHHLHLIVDAIMARESGRIIPYDDEQSDVPPFMRR